MIDLFACITYAPYEYIIQTYLFNDKDQYFVFNGNIYHIYCTPDNIICKSAMFTYIVFVICQN